MENLIDKCSICGIALIDGTLVKNDNYNINELQITESILSKDCALNKYGKKHVELMESLNKRKMSLFKFDYCSI